MSTGSNYLFAILQKDEDRDYDIISLFDAVALVKDEFNKATDKQTFDKEQIFKDHFEYKNNTKLLFVLKQLDMVYFPDENEEVILDKESPLFKPFWQNPERLKKIYTVTKFSGKEIYFNHHTIAEVLERKVELSSQNMLQTLNGRKIVEYCIPIQIDRLGGITDILL